MAGLKGGFDDREDPQHGGHGPSGLAVLVVGISFVVLGFLWFVPYD